MTAEPTPSPTPVAHGDRREEVHLETDSDQMVRVSHLVKPDRLPPDMVGSGPTGPRADGPPIQDAAVTPETPSVWDASPPGTE